MAAITIERNDIIQTKDGQTLRVMSTYYNAGVLSKIEGVDDNDPCKMRRPVFSAQIARVLKKFVKPTDDVKEGK